MDNMSLADIAAVTRDESFGGNWILVILFLLVFAGGGLGNRGYGDYNSAMNQEILFGQRFQAIDNKIDGIANGLSSLGYSQLQQMDANTASINGNVTAEGRALQNQMSATKYDLATAIHAEGELTRGMIQQNKIETLQGRINQLEMQNAMCGVVRYPMQSAYYAPNPFCNCNNGCNTAY